MRLPEWALFTLNIPNKDFASQGIDVIVIINMNQLGAQLVEE